MFNQYALLPLKTKENIFMISGEEFLKTWKQTIKEKIDIVELYFSKP